MGKVTEDTRPLQIIASSFGHVWPAKQIVDYTSKKKNGKKASYKLPFPAYKSRD